MSILDYVIMLVFTIVIIVAGLSFGKSGSNMKSYFAAGGAVPWQISSLSLFMSFFSAGTFVVWGSLAYQYGFVAVAIQLTMCVAGLVVGLYIAPAWQKSHSLTAAEFVSKRLGIKIQKFYSYLILLISLAYTGAFLYPVAKIINVSTGFSIEACVIVLGVLIIIYTVVGGLWAVMITDVLQFVVLTAAVIIVVPLAFDRVGGVDQFLASVPESFFSPVNKEYSWLFLLAFGIYNGIFIGGNWAYVQRYTSVDTPKAASKVGYLFAGLYLISPFIWMLPPMIYRVLNPNLSGLQNEGAYLMMCKEVLPKGMIGLMLGGMLFATGSSVNTTLNLAAAVFTNDLYKSVKPETKPKKLMFIAKLATTIFGVLTILVALLVPLAGGIVEIVLSVGAVTGCSLYGPPIWALFSKRHTGKSILWCTVLGLSINVYFKFFYPLNTGESLSRTEEMLAGAVIPLILLISYELWARSKNKIAVDYTRYKRQLDATVGSVESEGEEEPSESSESQNAFGLKVLARTMGIISVIFIVLAFVSGNALDVTLLIGVLIGVAALIINRRSKNEIKISG
ncbi:putative sodium-coupled permease [Arcticibacter svalbardensis MN12-7]|uniref:Putative sodium-coupled permease n=1 Tax=Arcticibacter svalbardensis MN12-7 TaxID=1150600 RepID=R9GQT2_9SPHI|nr:sodium:solute symporter family protein [Arcticibacter svalbardensis]EOR94167.1 putative sodium-coupled permease [Arcticibacter svalbardensis MN12-7]